MDDRTALRIYLSERIAVLRGGRRLAQRMRDSATEPGMGALLAGTAEALRDDEETFTSFLRQVGAAPPRLRIAAAVVGERLGVLKLNGRIAGRSPLSDLQELDAALALLELTASAWAALDDAGVAAPDVVDGREARLRDLADRLAVHRRTRAVRALAPA